MFQWVAGTSIEQGNVDDVSPKLIIYALCAVIVAMAGFIVKQFADRISDLKEQTRLASTLENVVQKERETR